MARATLGEMFQGPQRLLKGLDEIGLTETKAATIAAHEARAKAERPFLEPRAHG